MMPRTENDGDADHLTSKTRPTRKKDTMSWDGLDKKKKNTKNKYVDSRQLSTRVCTIHSLQLKRKKKSGWKISICSFGFGIIVLRRWIQFFVVFLKRLPVRTGHYPNANLNFLCTKRLLGWLQRETILKKIRRTSGWGDEGGRNLGKTTRTFCVSSWRKVVRHLSVTGRLLPPRG